MHPRKSQLQALSEKLERLVVGYEAFKASEDDDWTDYNISSRSEQDVLASIDEFTDRVWYERHQVLKYRLKRKQTTVDPKIWKGALNSAQIVEAKHCLHTLVPTSAFEWGMLNGKLSALRWVMGEELDKLNT